MLPGPCFPTTPAAPTLEHVFDGEEYRPRRSVKPPRAVLVDLARLYPPTRVRWATATPLWVKSRGLPLHEQVLGALTEWIVTSAGDWLGRVQLTVDIGGEAVTVDQLVPAAALTEARDATVPLFS